MKGNNFIMSNNIPMNNDNGEKNKNADLGPQFFDYDLNTLKNNVRKLMKEKGLTQQELAKSAGCPQSRISRIFNSSECFTVQQLVSIAHTYNVSTDTLIGLNTVEKPCQEEFTMNDICSRLFEINDSISEIKIGRCRTDNVQKNNSSDSEEIESETWGIYFDNKEITLFLEEWNSIKQAAEKAGVLETKEKIISLWENETLKTSKENKKEWHFRNRDGQKKYLAQLLIFEHKDPKEFTKTRGLTWTLHVNPESKKLLKEYMYFGGYVNDNFTDDDLETLFEAYSEYIKNDLKELELRQDQYQGKYEALQKCLEEDPRNTGLQRQRKEIKKELEAINNSIRSLKNDMKQYLT